jgi:thiamine-phosphate pyrophosphorylase
LNFELPRLYPILDTEVYEQRGFKVIDAARAVLDAGAAIIQFRHKGEFTEHRWQQAQAVWELCRSAGAQFVMNDRVDFATLLGSGVHLGQDDLPPAAARTVIGRKAMLGYSTHNDQQLREADSEPVDYIALGPIFSTGSKRKPDPVVGLEELTRLRPMVSKPLVAIGGITLANSRAVLDAGADSVAVISALLPGNGDLVALGREVELWLSRLTAQP